MGAQLAEEQDIRHLRRAIELAGHARGQTSPNPLVGAVVVKGGRVIGEGFHARAGEPHAERVALGACEEDPGGATLYVSLEPCAHDGRTPPCTQAIVDAGIARVVVASDDPSAKASGRGLGVLRDEGIAVATVDGEVQEAARLLNQPFRKHARTGRPLVIFKSAMTLDGKVATASGDSQWISGESSRARAHRWRSECDAVAVGIHTVAHDDPLLTARLEGVARQPRRVIFDSEASLSPDSKLVRSAGDAQVIVVCSRAAQAHLHGRPAQRGGRGDRGGRGQRGGTCADIAGRAGRARCAVAAARGRPAPGGRLPRGGRDRRGAHVRGAYAARRPRRYGQRWRRRESSASPTPRGRCTPRSSASTRTCWSRRGCGSGDVHRARADHGDGRVARRWAAGGRGRGPGARGRAARSP